MKCKVCMWANYPPCEKKIPCCDCQDECNSRQCLYGEGQVDWKEYYKKGGKK